MLIGAVPPFLLKTADNPEGVDGAVFDGMLPGSNGTGSASSADFSKLFYNWTPGRPTLGLEPLAYSKSIAWAASPMGTRQCILAFGQDGFRADLEKIEVPMLSSTVTRTGSCRSNSARRAAKMLRRARLDVIKGAPHGLTATHGPQLNRLMLDFLKS